MIWAKGPGSPHWMAMRRVRASSMARVASALSQGVFASSGTKMLSTRRARCSAPTVGKLLNTSPQPQAPSLADTRSHSAGRLLMAPNALASGALIGARSTQHSSLVMVGRIAAMLACLG